MINKIGLVAKHEFLSTLKRRSALFAIFGLPFLSLLILSGINWLSRSQGGNGENNLLTEFVSDEDEIVLPDGLVDDTGELQLFSPPAKIAFVPYPDLQAAQIAYEAGKINGYYHIPADYLSTGSIYQYAEEFSLDSTDSRLLYGILVESFVGDDAPINLVVNPLQQYEEIDLSATEAGPAQNYGAMLGVAMGVAVLFFLTVMGASGYLLQSLGKEKENRVMEILLSSIRPFELLAGKVVGLGGIGLVQMAVWTLLAVLVFGQNKSPFANVPMPPLPMSVWLVIIMHFITGYLVYASLFAGLGAMVPNVKEGSQYTFLIMLPTFLPLWFNSIMVSAPNGGFARFLSLFPMTAPIAMPMRLVVTAVPEWQWLLSLSLSAVTAVFLLWSATKFFRSQFLLSGLVPTPKNIWRTLRDV